MHGSQDSTTTRPRKFFFFSCIGKSNYV